MEKTGRRVGSIKASREQAVRFRKKGFSNQRIAKELGISIRTVTRYLGSSDDLSEQQSYPAFKIDGWKALFKSRYPDAMILFLVRALKHPDWQGFWSSVSKDRRKSITYRLQATAIHRLFRQFLEDSNTPFSKTNPDLLEAIATNDDTIINETWEKPPKAKPTATVDIEPATLIKLVKVIAEGMTDDELKAIGVPIPERNADDLLLTRRNDEAALWNDFEFYRLLASKRNTFIFGISSELNRKVTRYLEQHVYQFDRDND